MEVILIPARDVGPAYAAFCRSCKSWSGLCSYFSCNRDEPGKVAQRRAEAAAERRTRWNNALAAQARGRREGAGP